MSQRFSWNQYPATVEYIADSGLAGVLETPEFKKVYRMASTLFRGEGGEGDIDVGVFKVLTTSLTVFQ